MRPTWAEISRSALLANFDRLTVHAHARGAELLCVVKANSYGHGVEFCGPELAKAGAVWLGVTGVEEGVLLRERLAGKDGEAGPNPEILVMGGPWKAEGEAVLEHRLTAVVWEPYQLDILEQAARRAGAGPASVPVHLEVDSGMSRQGALPDEAREMFRRLAGSPSLVMTGLCTHYASAEVLEGAGEAQNIAQTGVFCRVALQGRHLGQYPQWLNAGNSATLCGRDGTLDRLGQLARGLGARLLVRPGLALYGYLQDEETQSGPLAPELAAELKPVLRWKTRINSLRRVPAGAQAGYNATWTAREDSVLALLPVGYADGFSRALSWNNANDSAPRWQVLVRGTLAPVVGRVSMDLIIVDVTHVAGVEIGDEVELMSDAAAMARQLGTISYEVLCGIGKRVPRVAVP